jgi:coenzyme F420-reducing hydrogenase delta subunit/Pyruvate/2-oxoacid:ferredoxin oxidoreductase delta subunit
LDKASPQRLKRMVTYDDLITGNKGKTLYHPKPLFMLSYTLNRQVYSVYAPCKARERGSRMTEKCLAVVNVNQDLCSRCCVCNSLCPYEAINRDKETGKVEIDIQKCQDCGICYSSCPSAAIEMEYYDYDHLMDYVDCVQKQQKADTLVLMCRGNSPSTCEIEDILADQGVVCGKYIPLRIPCSGRVPTDFVFKVLNSGIENIVSIQCEDKFCRYKEGTKINTRRLQLSKNVLEQLGFDKNAVKVVKYSRKAFWDNLNAWYAVVSSSVIRPNQAELSLHQKLSRGMRRLWCLRFGCRIKPLK